MKVISEYSEGNRIAKVIPRTLGGYRVWLYDIMTEQQDERYFDDKSDAEDIARKWCKYE